MPTLAKQDVVRHYLPSTEKAENEADRAWVELKTKFLAGELIEQTLTEMSGGGASVARLVALISAWNLKENEDDEEYAPINYETVARLDRDDFVFLAEKFSETRDDNLQPTMTADEKKTSTDTTSIESQTPTPTNEIQV